MAVSVVHSTVATLPDEPGAEINKAEWNANHTVSGLGTFADQDYASPPAIGGTTPAAGTFSALIAGTSFTVGNGSAATATIASNLSGSNDGAIVLGDNAVRLNPVPANTNAWLQNTLLTLGSGIGLGWASAASLVSATQDTTMSRVESNSIQFSATGTAGAATGRTEINKTVTAFTNAVAKSTFTVTIPNAAHTATIEYEITAFLGTGGAIGVNEAAATTSGKIIVTRTPGVNAVASAVSTAFGAVAANVAGATTATVAAAVSAIAGAVGAANTFTIDVTITRGGGSSDNHVALCYGKVMNANITGVTIA